MEIGLKRFGLKNGLTFYFVGKIRMLLGSDMDSFYGHEVFCLYAGMCGFRIGGGDIVFYASTYLIESATIDCFWKRLEWGH